MRVEYLEVMQEDDLSATVRVELSSLERGGTVQRYSGTRLAERTGNAWLLASAYIMPVKLQYPEMLESLDFWPHARRRMAQRGITEADVRDVLENFNVRVARTDGRAEYVGSLPGGRLKVITDETTVPRGVVTAYYLDEG